MLDDGIEPFREKLGDVVRSEKGEMGELLKKVKIIPIGYRERPEETLTLTAAVALNVRRR